MDWRLFHQKGQGRWAFSAMTEKLGPKGGLSDLTSPGELRRLVVKFDTDGREIHRERASAANGEFLFIDDGILTLIEHEPQAIELLRFDLNLQPRETRTLARSDLLVRLTAVLPDSEGGYFLAGCGANHSESVVHVEKSGGSSNVGVGRGNCDYWMELTEGEGPDDVLLLMDGKLIRLDLPKLN